MKKFFIVLTHFISILMFIGVIPLFILCLVFSSPLNGKLGIIFLCIWLPLLVAAIPLYLLTRKQANKILKEYFTFSKESIKIKAKHGKVFINTNTQTFKFKKIKVQFQDIVEFQLVNNQTVIDKSGIGESLVGGMLFGGSGAIAGALVGKKQKVKDNYKVFIKTKNIKHAGIVITLKIDNAYNLFETLKLITKKK